MPKGGSVAQGGSVSARGLRSDFASSTPRHLTNEALGLSELLPDVEVVPVHLAWGDEHASLQDGRVDLAFIQYPVGATLPRYVVRGITRRSRVVVMSSGHRLARRKHLTLTDIAAEPILDPGFEDVPEMHRDFWLGEPRPHEGNGPSVVHLKMRTVEEMYACVAAGRGLAITSGAVSEQYPRPDLAFLPVRDLDPVEIGIARLRSDKRTEVGAAMDGLAVVADIDSAG